MVAPMCSPIQSCSHETHSNHMGQKWEYHFGTSRGEGLMTIQPLPSSDAWVVGLPRPRHPQKHRRQTWPSLFRHPLSVDSPFQTFHALVGCFVCVHEDWYGYQVERGIARKYWVHTYILGRENMCIDTRMFHNDPVSSVSKSCYSWTKHMPEQVHPKPAWLQNPNVQKCLWNDFLKYVCWLSFTVILIQKIILSYYALVLGQDSLEQTIQMIPDTKEEDETWHKLGTNTIASNDLQYLLLCQSTNALNFVGHQDLDFEVSVL